MIEVDTEEFGRLFCSTHALFGTGPLCEITLASGATYLGGMNASGGIVEIYQILSGHDEHITTTDAVTVRAVEESEWTKNARVRAARSAIARKIFAEYEGGAK